MLIEEKQALRRAMPRLAAILAEHPLLEAERLGADTLAGWFRDHGEPGFLVPAELGGRGHRLADLAPVCSAVAAACPSLGVMMLMHHHTVAAFAFDPIPVPRAQELLAGIAQQRWLLGSAFAESREGVDLLDSSVTCVADGEDYRLDGSKKPCTMSRQADLFLVGVTDRAGAGRSRGLAIVERSKTPIRVERFWTQPILAGTGSECIHFDGARVQAGNVLLPAPGGEGVARLRFAVAQSEITISMIFQTLMAAGYLGVAARLYELAIARARRVDGNDALMFLACELEAARFAQYRLAQRIDGGTFSGEQLGQAMALSWNAIRRMDALIAEIEARPELRDDEECAYLARVCGAMKRHPPSQKVRRDILASCYLPD
jgi:alkylation response protein AidB-like acyl-CoA dehydrogenase